MSAEMTLVRALAERHPSSVARVLEETTNEDAAALLAELAAADAAAVLRNMAPIAAARVLEISERKSAAALLLELPVDLGAALLRRTSEPTRRALLGLLGGGPRARSLAELLQHQPGTAGALMDPMALALPEELPVADAIEQLKRDAQSALYYVYVIGENGRLVGVVNQRELMVADSSVPLAAIMKREPHVLLAQASRESIASHPAWQQVHALPVVDPKGLFLGAIRYETVRRLERELGRAARAPERHATAAALAELYGIGVAGFVEWASASVRGPVPRRRGSGS